MARIQNDDIRFHIKAVHSIFDVGVVVFAIAVIRSTTVCLGERRCAENTNTKNVFYDAMAQTVSVDDECDEN